MDEELERAFTGLRKQINDGNERLLERITQLAGDVRDLRSEHDVTRDLVAKLPGTVLGAIEAPLLKRLRAAEDRLDKLERPDAP